MEGKGRGVSGRLRGETRGKGGFWRGPGGVRGGERATELLRCCEEGDTLGGGLGRENLSWVGWPEGWASFGFSLFLLIPFFFSFFLLCVLL